MSTAPNEETDARTLLGTGSARSREVDEFFELILDPACVLDFEGRLVCLNAAFARTLGHEVTDLLDRPFHAWMHPDDVARSSAIFEQGASQGLELRQWVIRGLHADGSERRLEWNARFDPERMRVYAVARDVTQREAERETHQAQVRELAARERRLAQLIASTSAVLYVRRATGARETTYLSPNVDRQLGWERDEFMGGQPDWTRHVHPQDRVRMAAFEPLFERGRQRTEYRLRSSDGEYRWVQDERNLFYDEAGEPLEIVGVLTDIDARKRMVSDLIASNQDLEQLAYAASHDLQEPLRMVTSYAQLIARALGDRMDDELRRHVEFVVEGAKRMQTLMIDLLRFSRINVRTEQFRSVDTYRLVQDVIGDLRWMIEASNAEVTCGSLPIVRGDAVRLGLVFHNLLSNALKFRREEPPRVRITADRVDEAMWRFSVEDNGIGIDARYRRQIFGMFRRLHLRDEYPGNGVGLTIARRVVERHGGRIWLSSRVGEGSTFHFTVPAVGEG